MARAPMKLHLKKNQLHKDVGVRSEILRKVGGSAGCRQKPTVDPHDRTRNTQACAIEMPIRYALRATDGIVE